MAGEKILQNLSQLASCLTEVQRSYVTKNLKDRLALSSNRVESLNASTFELSTTSVQGV